MKQNRHTQTIRNRNKNRLITYALTKPNTIMEQLVAMRNLSTIMVNLTIPTTLKRRQKIPNIVEQVTNRLNKKKEKPKQNITIKKKSKHMTMKLSK